WDVIGGHVEEGEDPKDCILREMKEELQTWSFNGRNLPLWRIIDFPDRIDYAFWDYLGSQSLNTLNKNLTEGQRVCSFALGEVLNMELAYGWQPYVVEFFEGRRRRRHIEDPTH
ncbi:MAG: NUDIX domain-containing protein, partial [Patescibacteria group bacterium]